MLFQYFTCCSMRVYNSAGNVIEAHKHAGDSRALGRANQIVNRWGRRASAILGFREPREQSNPILL